MAGTAAKIELLKYDGRWFLRNEIGENVRDEKGWTIFFKSEAEALEKAAKLREWEEKESGRSEARDQKYDRNLDRRPVETRPPAPRAMPHVDDETGTQCADTCWCKTSEPVEQAAPPRPLCKECNDTGELRIWDTRESSHIAICECRKEPAAPAAIEQARPQTPTLAEHARPTTPWIIWYDDADVKPDVFVGYGAEEAARKTYAARLLNWNCYLLTTAAAEPAPERTPPCSNVWHLKDAPCVCAEREKALLKDGWYIQEYPFGIATKFILWHQSPGYETGESGSSKGHEEINATVAFLLKRVAARAVAVPETAHVCQLETFMGYSLIELTRILKEHECPAAQQGDCRSDCIRHQSCIRQRETRTDNLQTQAEPAPTPSRADWKSIADELAEVHYRSTYDKDSRVGMVLKRYKDACEAEVSSLGAKPRKCIHNIEVGIEQTICLSCFPARAGEALKGD